jgi:tetratricopeptide (TPR) repeat protein
MSLNENMKRINQILRSPWSIAVGLLILCALTYGTLIKVLGFYWDDWPSVWFLHFFGPKVFPGAFAADRPVQGWLFVLTTWIFGESLLAWQVFGILARWISAISLGGTLISLWPNRRWQVVGVAILFLVYPGFSQQFIALTYGHQFLIMALFFLSLTAMIWSIRDPAKYWVLTFASIISGLLSMFALEYFFGLELLRPAILWILFSENFKEKGKRLRQTIKHWLPYLLMDIGFLTWRLTHATPRGEVTLFSNLSTDPISTLENLVRTIGTDIYESALLAWVKIFSYFNFAEFKLSVLVGYAVTAVAVTVLSIALLALARSKKKILDNVNIHLPWGVSALSLGILALLFGGWPFWVTDLRLELAVPWDRFTEPMMIGACLALVGLVDLVIRPFWPKIILISVMAGMAAGTQFHYALDYRQEWIDQRTFFWQLAWRVPAIEPGTLLLTSDLPFFSTTDNSLTAPINWIYAPELDSREMPYLLYDINARLGNRLPSLDPGVAISQDYRATNFEGSTSQSLVFYYHPPRCLKILDLYTDRHYPNKPGLVVQALPLSNLDLIKEANSDSPIMPAFLNPELKHNWCYYFEKVDLYVQLGKWNEAVKYADKALKNKSNLTQDNAPELIPFIYAYARAGKYDTALELSMQVGDLSNKMHYYLCDTWFYLSKRIQGDPGFEAALKEVNRKNDCTPP